jgi:hypothetical protein
MRQRKHAGAGTISTEMDQPGGRASMSGGIAKRVKTLCATYGK